MRLRDKSPSQLKQNFWSSISKIQSALGFDIDEIATLLSLSQKEFRRLLQLGKTPRVDRVFELASRTGLSFEALVNDKFDVKAMARHYFEDHSSLPERYLLDPLSKKRTVLGILDCIEATFGYNKRASVLRHFQVNEKMLENPNDPINLKLSIDISEFFYSLSKDLSLLSKFGLFSIQTNYGNVLGQTLRRNTGSPREAFEVFLDEMLPRYVESNYSWNIDKISDSEIVVAGSPNETLRREMLKNPDTHSRSCYIRGGFISGIPTLINFPAYKMHKIACTAHGDESCLFSLVPQEVMPLS